MVERVGGLPVARTVADLRLQVSAWRGAGQKIGLVPTMGALHQGHLALVRHVRDKGAKAVATIFVNPTQFGPKEDFSAYPRQEAADAEKLESVGADLLFAPTVAEMYPQGFATQITVSGVSAGLCGDSRPGHFQGVATVVAKLLLQALPDFAVFGEKDYQQLQVIRRMARDLDIPVAIEGFPTVREADGLAMSSRNAYLTPEERAKAPLLHRVLTDIAAAAAGGGPFAEALAAGRERLTAAGFGPIDYLEIRDAENLALVERVERPARIFVAARLGKARLIDNIPVK